MKKSKGIFLIALVAIFTISSCKKDDETVPDTPENDEFELVDNTVVINEETSQKLISVGDTRIAFSGNTNQLESIEEGDFLVSEPVKDIADYGYLKKVISIQKDGDDYIFEVEDGYITDVVKNGKASFRYTLTPQDTFRNSNFTDVFEEILFDADGNSLTTENNIGMKGGYSFTADVIFDLEIEEFEVKYLRVGLEVDNNYYLDVVAGHSIGINSITKEVPVFSFPLRPLVFRIGGFFPIIINSDLYANLGISGDIEAEISAGSDRNVTNLMYAEYSDGIWSPYHEKNIEDNNFELEIAGGVDIDAYLSLGLKFKLYNSNFATSDIHVDGYLKAEAVCGTDPPPSCSKTLRAGLRALAEINLKIFRSSLVNFTETLFDGSVILIEDEYTDGGVFIGDTILYTQSEVNAFGSNNYSKIQGSLVITGDDIVDLSPLNSISEISGTFRAFQADGIIDFSGMENLESVGTNMKLTNCDGLKSLYGLSSLSAIGGNLEIENCNSLENIDALESLGDVHMIHLENNSSLVSIKGLSNLEQINSLVIDNNDNLTNLEGLDVLSSVYQLFIKSNDGLTSLTNLSNLNNISEIFLLSENISLSNLNGLNNLSSVNDLFLVNNIVLDDFCALTDLSQSGSLTGTYYVYGNAYNPTQQDLINGNCTQ